MTMNISYNPTDRQIEEEWTGKGTPHAVSEVRKSVSTNQTPLPKNFFYFGLVLGTVATFVLTYGFITYVG